MTNRDSKNDLVWLHIGAGSFHRAHQAVYLHRLRGRGTDDERRWQLALGNIRADMAPLLKDLEQSEGRYTLETVTPQGQRAYETIRAICDIVPWDAQLKNLVVAGFEPLACYTRELAEWLRRLDRAGATLGGIDTGSFVLAEAGLLGGEDNVTVHWEALSAMAASLSNSPLLTRILPVDRKSVV